MGESPRRRSNVTVDLPVPHSDEAVGLGERAPSPAPPKAAGTRGEGAPGASAPDASADADGLADAMTGGDGRLGALGAAVATADADGFGASAAAVASTGFGFGASGAPRITSLGNA